MNVRNIRPKQNWCSVGQTPNLLLLVCYLLLVFTHSRHQGLEYFLHSRSVASSMCSLFLGPCPLLCFCFPLQTYYGSSISKKMRLSLQHWVHLRNFMWQLLRLFSLTSQTFHILNTLSGFWNNTKHHRLFSLDLSYLKIGGVVKHWC